MEAAVELPAVVGIDHKVIVEERKDFAVAVAACKDSARLVSAVVALQGLLKLSNLAQERTD